MALTPYPGSDDDRVAALEVRLKRLEAEHESFIKRFFGPHETSQLEEDLRLTADAQDARISELQARLDGGTTKVAVDVIRKIRQGMQELKRPE